MNEKEKAELRTKTETRQPGFLADCHEYDGRAAKAEFKARTQNDHKVHQKSCY